MVALLRLDWVSDSLLLYFNNSPSRYWMNSIENMYRLDFLGLFFDFRPYSMCSRSPTTIPKSSLIVPRNPLRVPFLLASRFCPVFWNVPIKILSV